MGLGSTAKKVQKMAELSQELYGRVNELKEQITGVRDTVDGTHERVVELEAEVAEQRALLEALASHQGVDVEAALDSVAEEETAGDGEDAAQEADEGAADEPTAAADGGGE